MDVEALDPIRLAPGATLVVATHNAGKLAEIEAMVAPFGLKAVSAGALGLPEPEETGSTFEENAALKAHAAAQASGHIALADDSGLAVDALGGDPGIYSARWAGPDKDFARAMRNVEEGLQRAGATTPQGRGARFVAVLCLAAPDGRAEFFRGEVEGTLVWPPRGDKGFGYDPMFLPEGETRTFGEMSSEEKHGLDDPLSHRARAFALFAAARLAG
ncbi:RdgB/HAM1 family non-canonical purine NTP pyrophosphatase [Prosthecomicrobium pneumaticum]|uniref:dITP/XTP pyrophosphatase n=1 Tax=Prosthecomicrobium pneumaticum TaxID=81895 RepID=A0A7W9FJQ5_9HYPH|nr:RdgB/HAM1 family non-canonical purine NTP pyrophosphatase [Prosthecomicrobium pneumaticum]MBB5751826.1 XTP/dITP diphosphohydrolase [Prosthecomicrobium pneumaticum]